MRAGNDVRAWLRRRGAERIPHPGGTLHAHLCRVQDRLAELGHGVDVIEQDPAIAAAHGSYFREVFTSWAPLTSAPVAREVRRVLGVDDR